MVGGGGTSPWPPDPSDTSVLNKGSDPKRRRCAEDLPGASGRANGDGHRLMVAEEAEGEEGELVVDEELAVEEDEAVIPPGVEAASPGNGKAARRKADMLSGTESDRKKENRLTVIIDQLLSNRAKGQEACPPGNITSSGEGQSETESAGATELQQTPSAAVSASATTTKTRRRRGGSAATGRAEAASGLGPSGSVKAERLSPSSGGSSRGSVSPGGGAATPSSSSAASTYPGTPPGERGSPGGGAAGASGPPTLPSPHPPLQHTPALKQMEQMMTRNYSDFMRSLAAKYNNSNPNDYFSTPRNGFLSGLDSRFTPFKSGGGFPGLAPIPTTATRGSATPPTPPPPHHTAASASAASAKEAADRGVPQYNLYSASATFPATSAASLAAFHHPLIDMSSTQALISMVRSASAQSASQLETYLKGAAGALKRPAPTAADPTASTSSAVAAAAAAASSSSPLDLSSSSGASSASSLSSNSSSSAACSMAAASALAAAAASAASACKKARTMDGGKGLLLGGGLAGSLLLPHTIVKAESEDILPRKEPKKGISSVSPRPRGNRTLPTPPPVTTATAAHLPPPPPPPPLHSMHHSRMASVSNASPCMSLCTDASKPCMGATDSSDPREAVARWSVDDVCNFVSSIDICAEYAPIFRDQRIDGSALPLLTEEHLTSALSMKLGPALKLRAALARRLGHCAVCLHCVHCHGVPAAPKPPTPATTPSPAPTPPAATPAPAAPSPAASPAPVPAAMSPASAGLTNAASNSSRSPSASGEVQ